MTDLHLNHSDATGAGAGAGEGVGLQHSRSEGTSLLAPPQPRLLSCRANTPMHAKRAHVRRRKAQPEVKRQEKRSDTEALRRRQRLHAARERGCAMAALTNRALEEAACVLGPRAPTLKRIPRSVTHQQRLKRHHRLKAEYAEAVQSFAAVLPCVAARLARERGDAATGGGEVEAGVENDPSYRKGPARRDQREQEEEQERRDAPARGEEREQVGEQEWRDAPARAACGFAVRF